MTIMAFQYAQFVRLISALSKELEPTVMSHSMPYVDILRSELCTVPSSYLLESESTGSGLGLELTEIKFLDLFIGVASCDDRIRASICWQLISSDDKLRILKLCQNDAYVAAEPKTSILDHSMEQLYI